MTNKFEPYKFEAFTKLMQRAYGLGWYAGTHNLFRVTMQGAFEGWSGRASETWEQHFIVEFRIPAKNSESLPPEKVYKEEGKTLEEACQKILARFMDED